MKKLTKKSIITIVTVLLLVVALGTATFAWITINNMASVRGMRMEVDTTNSLQIEEGTEIVEADFTNKIVDPANNGKKYLQPISSTNGVDFYYTPNLITGVDGNGKLNDNAKIYAYDAEDFGLLYESVYPDLYASGEKVVGYAEYNYILKAYASTAGVGVYITDIDFINNSTGLNAKAFRMAVLTKTLGADGTFADQPYESQGIISFEEQVTINQVMQSVGRSIKNNSEYLAFGKTTAGSVQVDENTTINQYRTNYGNVLFKAENDTKYYLDAKATKEYELVLATDDEARLDLGSVSPLRTAEKVSALSFETFNGKYKFTTNQGVTVYGDNQESANNTDYYKYENNAFVPYTLRNNPEKFVEYTDEYFIFSTNFGRTLYCTDVAPNDLSVFYTELGTQYDAFEFDDSQNEEIDGDIVPVLVDGFYEFTTTLGNKIYGDNEDPTQNAGYVKIVDFATELGTQNEAYVFDNSQNEEIDDSVAPVLVDGLYEFTTTLGNKVYGENEDPTQNAGYVTIVEEVATIKLLPDNSEGKAVTLLNGVTYYEFKTTDGRAVYCASKTANGPLFDGTLVDEEAVVKPSYYDVVKEFDSTKPLLTLDQGDTGYVLVTLRIWVEGEDQDCNNSTFLTLGKDYEMNIDFGVVAPEDPIYLK